FSLRNGGAVGGAALGPVDRLLGAIADRALDVGSGGFRWLREQHHTDPVVTYVENLGIDELTAAVPLAAGGVNHESHQASLLSARERVEYGQLLGQASWPVSRRNAWPAGVAGSQASGLPIEA